MIVIGIGTEFRHDDGAGPAVVAALRGRLDGATLAITDGEPARLIDLWAGRPLAVVVDAVRADPAQPGRIHELDLQRAAALTPTSASSHALGLGAAVALGGAVGALPDRLVVYAIEGGDFSLGVGLSAPVAAAVPHVAEHIEGLWTQAVRGPDRDLRPPRRSSAEA